MSADDNFKAWGLPVFLVLMLVLSVALTHKQLRAAHAAIQTERSHAGLFWAALVATLMSMFLYFTAAWSYGVVSSFSCYAIALLCASRGMENFGRHLVGFQALWFGILIGQPSLLSRGVIFDITNSCAAWYVSEQSTMCKSGWLTFASIMAGLIIGLNFLILITTLASALGTEVFIPEVGGLGRGGGGGPVSSGRYQAVDGPPTGASPPPPYPQRGESRNSGGYQGGYQESGSPQSDYHAVE